MHPETRRFREVARKQVAPMSLKHRSKILPFSLPSFLNSTLNYRRFYFRDHEPLLIITDRLFMSRSGGVELASDRALDS